LEKSPQLAMVFQDGLLEIELVVAGMEDTMVGLKWCATCLSEEKPTNVFFRNMQNLQNWILSDVRKPGYKRHNKRRRMYVFFRLPLLLQKISA
jgi:hypothetical protein